MVPPCGVDSFHCLASGEEDFPGDNGSEGKSKRETYLLTGLVVLMFAGCPSACKFEGNLKNKMSVSKGEVL